MTSNLNLTQPKSSSRNLILIKLNISIIVTYINVISYVYIISSEFPYILQLASSPFFILILLLHYLFIPFILLIFTTPSYNPPPSAVPLQLQHPAGHDFNLDPSPMQWS